MYTTNTCTPNICVTIVLPDVVKEVHLVHEKTWKAIPCYTELHLPGLDCLRSHQCWEIAMDVMIASFGTDDWVLMSVYKEVPQLLPSATEIISSVPFTCYLILCHVIEQTTVVVKFLKRVGLYRDMQKVQSYSWMTQTLQK